MLVANRPPIHEQILAEGIGTRESGQPGKAGDAHARPFGIDSNSVATKVRAKHVAETRQLAAVRKLAPRHWRPLFASKRERHIRPTHRQPPYHFAYRFGLATVGFQEFQPRG